MKKLTYNNLLGAFVAFAGVLMVFTGGKGVSFGGNTLIGVCSCAFKLGGLGVFYGFGKEFG